MSKADLFGFALLIAFGGSLLGHWYADRNTHMLSREPWLVLYFALFIGFPFYLLALVGARALRIWILFGVLSLLFWGAIFWFLRHFTT